MQTVVSGPRMSWQSSHRAGKQTHTCNMYDIQNPPESLLWRGVLPGCHCWIPRCLFRAGIWQHQAIDCLDHSWFISSSESKSTSSVHERDTLHVFGHHYTFKINTTSPRNQWVDMSPTPCNSMESKYLRKTYTLDLILSTIGQHYVYRRQGISKWM